MGEVHLRAQNSQRRDLSHAHSDALASSFEATEVAEGGIEQEAEDEFFFDFPVRGRKIKTVSHSVAR
jgi:hypothetical protein